MQQGDQYALPVKITDANGIVISPDNCYDVKIQNASSYGLFPNQDYEYWIAYSS